MSTVEGCLSKPKQSPNPQNTRSSCEDEPNVIQKLNTFTQPTKICPQSDPHKDEGLFRPHHNINCKEEERQRNKKWWLQHCVTDYSPSDRLSAGAALCCQATQKQHTRSNGSRAWSFQKCTTEDCRLLVWVLHSVGCQPLSAARLKEETGFRGQSVLNLSAASRWRLIKPQVSGKQSMRDGCNFTPLLRFVCGNLF